MYPCHMAGSGGSGVGSTQSSGIPTENCSDALTQRSGHGCRPSVSLTAATKPVIADSLEMTRVVDGEVVVVGATVVDGDVAIRCPWSSAAPISATVPTTSP